MKKIIPYVLLVLIIILAIATRFYKLGSAPSGFYIDEASQGYNAFSILKTGKDEFGKAFPIVFRAFTDFRTPVYTYLITPLIPIFGLKIFTVRFPSFVAGVFTIPILYFLIEEVSGHKKILSLVTALLLAVSPWHILYSRTAYETNIALFLLLTAILLLYKSFSRPFLLILSAVCFSLSIVSYQSERVIVPLVLICLFFRYRSRLLDKKHLFFLKFGLLSGLVILLPTIVVAFTPGFWARANGLNIISHLRQMPDGFIFNYKGILEPVINSSLFLTTREFFALYFSYFSPRYMFYLGDYGPRSSFPELSTYYLWQFPFYIYGFWLLLKNRSIGELKFFALIILLISPIPAAITRDPYTTIRAFPLVIPQILLISLAINEIFIKTKNYLITNFSIMVFLILITYSVFKLYSSVIILNEYYRAKAWDYGWQQVAEVIKNMNPNLPIVVDNARSDAYPQLAFFLKYEPTRYQKENFEIPLTQYYTNMFHDTEKHIGNIVTRPIDWEKDLSIDQYLVGDELGISLQQIEIHKLTLISQINYPDGTPAYRVVKTNPVWEMQQR